MMEKSLKITHLKDHKTDFSYWQTKTEQERLEAIELLRQQYIKYIQNVQQGFQRVCRVIDLEQKRNLENLK